MPAWDSADLLRRFKREAGMADVSEDDDTVDLYPILAAAQTEVMREIATRYPACLYGLQGPIQLTSTDGGKTFGFGTDGGGNAVLPMGWVQIATRLSAFTGDRSSYWREGVDFLDEGTRIRIPGDRTYTGTLYARFVPTPPDISATTPPVLLPVEARALIAIRAAEDWAGEGETRPALVARMQAKWAEKFPIWMLTWRRRFRGGGAVTDPARWYLTTPDLTSR